MTQGLLSPDRPMLNGETWFGLRGKEYLRKLIWQVAEFSRGRVVICAVMDNDFHLLAGVPPGRVVPDEEVSRLSIGETSPWQPL